MKKFLCIATETGGLDMTDYQRNTLKQFLKENKGKRVRLEVDTIAGESRKQRAFYHGAIIPLVAYFQENMNHRDYNDLETVHDWLKLELNGEFVEIRGKSLKVGKTTRTGLSGFIERVIEWMSEQGYPVELLNPAEYKKWSDEVFPFEGADNYLDYLSETGKLKTPEYYAQ